MRRHIPTYKLQKVTNGCASPEVDSSCNHSDGFFQRFRPRQMKECQQTLPQLRQNSLAMPQLHPEGPSPQLITRGHEGRISTPQTSCCGVVRCARLLPEAVWIRMHFAKEITQRSGHRIPETEAQRQRFTVGKAHDSTRMAGAYRTRVQCPCANRCIPCNVFHRLAD